MSSVRSNFIWNASYQVARIIIPLVTIPYLTRILGSDQLGVYSYTYAIANYAHLFIILGLNQYGNREIAKVREDFGARSRAFWSIYVMQACTGLVVIAIYSAYLLLASGDYFFCSLLWLFWVVGEAFDIGWFFFGMEEFKVMTIRNLVIRLAVVGGIFLFVNSPEDVWVYCLLQSGSFFLSSLVLWPMLRSRVSFYRPSVREVVVHVRPNLVLFAPVIAIACYTQLDKIFLGWWSSMSEVAFFDNADKVSTIPLAVIQALGTVMLPRMSRLNAAGDSEAAKRYLRTSIWAASVMAWAFCFGIMAIAPDFVPVFFGAGYEKCEVLMPLLALMIPLVAWSNVLGVQWLLPLERDRHYLASVLAGAVVSVAVCMLLVPRFQSVGAAIATVAAELVVTGLQMWFVRHELPLGGFARDALPYMVFGVVMFACVRGVSLLLDGGALGLCIEIATGIVAYSALCAGWMLARHDERLQMLFPKARQR